MSYPVGTLHILIELSYDPDAISCPLGEKSRLKIEEE